MIDQLNALLRLKTLKEEQAFRALKRKQAQAEDAQLVTLEARSAVADDAATLPQREDAIYAEAIGAVVQLNALDDIRDRVGQLEQQHLALKDALERAEHVQYRLEGEVKAAAMDHRRSLKTKDKYGLITGELSRAAADLATLQEENEIEELFARPVRRAV